MIRTNRNFELRPVYENTGKDSMADKEIENVTFQGNSMLYPLRRVKMEQQQNFRKHA